MPELSNDIAAFEKQQSELEAEHLGKWVLFHNAELIGLFGSFEEAAAKAVASFGRGPYLIRQIGAAPQVLPASVMFRSIHA